MVRRITTLLLLIACIPVEGYAQKEAAHWVFGGFGGVDFTCATPQLNATPFSGLEGGACISSAGGELLMITNGDAVWDRDFHLMPNGQGLGGLCSGFGNGASASQSALIIPHPGNSNLYYIFTSDCAEDLFADGIRYSIVDMSLNGGMGGVVEKNRPLVANAAEKIAAIFQPNGKDVWVVTHGINSNTFYAFSITGAGLSITPVISSTGQVHPGGRGYLKFSPDGGRMVATSFVQGFDDGIWPELFTFDKATGKVMSDFVLPTASRSIYSVSFSPNGKVLYASCSWTCGWSDIEQFNLEAGTPQQIADQRYTIPQSKINGALQLSIDGRLYFLSQTLTGYNYLGVINDPNKPGVACAYNGTYMTLLCWIQPSWGLPNFIESYFEVPVTPSTQCQPQRKDLLNAIGFTPIVDCSTRKLTIDNTSVMHDIGEDVPLPYMYWVYDFGDGQVYTAQDQSDVTHTYNEPGTYDVTLSASILGICPINRSVKRTVIISPLVIPRFVTTQDCQSLQVDFVNQTPDQFDTMAWNWQFGDNSAENNSTDKNPSHRYTAAGTYTVTLKLIGTCDAVIMLPVRIYEPLDISLGPDATFCYAETHALTAAVHPDAIYQWSNGERTVEITVDTPGAYTVELTRNNCSVSDVINLSYRDCELCPKIIKDLHIGNDTLICETDVARLDVDESVPGDFLWSDGSTGYHMEVLQAGKYWLKLTQGNCESSDTVTIDTRDCTFCDVFVPNVITPNEDEKNDDFLVSVACEHYAFRMDIYNRWGTKVFSAEAPLWNGRLGNDTAPSGIYYYVVQYSFIGPQSRVLTHQKKGWLNILN